MKIQNINPYKPQAITKSTAKNHKKAIYKHDEVSFNGNKTPKNSGFFNSVKKFFKGETIPQIACYTQRENLVDLSDEEIKSENIKKIVGEVIKSYHTILKKGISTHSEIKEILKMGSAQGYKGTLKYNPSDNANVTFGDINPKTNLPTNILMWKNGEFIYSYEILNANPIEYKLNVSDHGINTVQEGIGDEIITLQQHDLKFHLVKQFDKTERGFNYLFGHVKDDEHVDIKKRLYFDFYDINGCLYGEGTPEGIPLYMYNKEQDLWEQQALIEFEE